MIERLKNAFLHDYKEAISKYGCADYVSFLRNMRPALEWLCKIVTLDVLGDVNLYNALLNGNKTVSCDWVKGVCSISNGDGEAKEESSLAFLARNAIYYSKPQLLENVKVMKRAKKTIDQTFQEIYFWYGKISGEGSHAKLEEDAIIQSEALVSLLSIWFKELKKVMSSETIEFFDSLPIPMRSETFSITEKAVEDSNNFIILDELTNRFEQIPGVNYIALLPENLTDKYGKPLSTSQLQEFYRIQWNFVVDLNKKTADGLFEQAPSAQKSSLRIITDNISEVSGLSNMTNWLFAKGRIDLSGFDDKKALRDTPKLFGSVFSKIVRTGMTNDYLILDFCSGSSKLSIRLFNKLEDIFGNWDAVQERCKIISFSKDSLYRNQLTEWADDYGVFVTFVDSTFGDFINHIADIKPKLTESSPTRLLVRGNSKDLTESRERYRAAGIEFFGPTQTKEERKWDFYSGAEITWEELDKQFDVQRTLYRVVKQRVSEIIRTTRRTSVYTLRHRPGSGATTLARRLGYDIKKEDEVGIISCTVVDIRNCSNIRLTEQYLSQLSEETENTPILAIVESKRVGREKFDNLVKRMSDAAKKIVFFYVEPFTGASYHPRENVALLESFLRNDEQNRFEEKYKLLGLSEKLLADVKKVNTALEVIDFPLMLRDNETSNNLSSYVKEWMDTLPDNLKEFCAYVGFVFKYSDLGINQTLLKPIWADTEHIAIRTYGKEEQNAIKKLLVEESLEDGTPTGIWRPRYNRFSKFILSAYKVNWESGLSDIAKNFISLCQKAGELGSDDKDMLYSVFIIRKNADYRAIEDKGNIKNKFSLLVKDLDDTERAESLFSALVNAFPEDSVFRGHFARFLYEKASMTKDIEVNDRLFADAQDNLYQAFDLNPNDSDLHHMQGMLYRRRINALTKQFNRDINEDPDNVDLREIEDCLIEWTDSAYNAFEKSIQLSPASPYGYAAESQLFRESIMLGQKILNCSDYLFCETNPIYSDYTEKLGNVLDLFEQICYTFKNDGLTQIMNSLPIYESVRLFHQNLVGQNQESIQRYRSKYSSEKGDKKLLYGSLLVKSILYSRTKTKDTRRAYSNLSRQEKEEIENVLEYQKNQGDVKSYETLFMLKLYSPEEFSLDEAIDLLKEWERQYIEGDKNGWGYLNACFYLAVCYCAKSIQGKVQNKEISSLAMSYFNKSEEFAKKFDKGTIQPQCYFGERNDIHCIVDKYRKDSDACTVTGVIHNIKNNKGILRMQCGVDVTFNAKGFDIMRDEGQTLRGVLGFAYSGPGLYDFRPDTDSGLKEVAMEIQEERELSYEELEQSYAPAEDLVDEPVVEIEQSEESHTDSNKTKIGIKQVGFIDVSNFTVKDKKVSRKNNNVSSHISKDAILHPTKNISGLINFDRTRVSSIASKKYFIIERTEGFMVNCSPKEYDYGENEEVIFDLKETIDPRTGKPFFFAINIRPACEEE